MKLKEFLKKEKITYRKFSELSGLDFSAVCRIANGKRGKNLRQSTIDIIFKVTSGKVTDRDLYDAYAP